MAMIFTITNAIFNVFFFFFFNLDSKIKVEIYWLSDRTRYNDAHLQQGSSTPRTIADIDRS